MSGKYTAEWASALVDLINAGAPVSFVLTSPGVQNAATGLYSNPVTTTVAGYAMAVKGDPIAYQALGLVESEALTLFFCAATYGDVPPLTASCVFGGSTYTVKSVSKLAPDGYAITSRAVVAR